VRRVYLPEEESNAVEALPEGVPQHCFSRPEAELDIGFKVDDHPRLYRVLSITIPAEASLMKGSRPFFRETRANRILVPLEENPIESDVIIC
jgi:hypothetical protein